MGVSFIVEGRPVPQGSMTASYNRETGTAHVHHVQGAALAAWRADIRREARAAGASLLLTPVAISITFGMQRPVLQTVLRRGHRVVRRAYENALPAVAPDLDKLVRAVLDALTGVCYDDDRQVVVIIARKVYANHTHVSVEPVSATAIQTSFGLA